MSTNPTLYNTNSRLLPQYTSSYSPYITTIRIYDENNKHIATSTLSNPIKKEDLIDQTFKIQFIKYL